MPTVLREEGFEVRIYTLDHPPPHVHVAKAGAIVRIDLATRTVTEIVGTISDRDVKRVGATRRAARETSQGRMDEHSWQRLMSRRRIANGTHGYAREERRARRIRRLWWRRA